MRIDECDHVALRAAVDSGRIKAEAASRAPSAAQRRMPDHTPWADAEEESLRWCQVLAADLTGRPAFSSTWGPTDADRELVGTP